MNTENLHELINRYENNYALVNDSKNDEKFKWDAVRGFRDVWLLWISVLKLPSRGLPIFIMSRWAMRTDILESIMGMDGQKIAARPTPLLAVTFLKFLTVS